MNNTKRIGYLLLNCIIQNICSTFPKDILIALYHLVGAVCLRITCILIMLFIIGGEESARLGHTEGSFQ